MSQPQDYVDGTSGKRLLVAAVVLGLLVLLTGAYQTKASGPGYSPGPERTMVPRHTPVLSPVPTFEVVLPATDTE